MQYLFVFHLNAGWCRARTHIHITHFLFIIYRIIRHEYANWDGSLAKSPLSAVCILLHNVRKLKRLTRRCVAANFII